MTPCREKITVLVSDTWKTPVEKSSQLSQPVVTTGPSFTTTVSPTETVYQRLLSMFAPSSWNSKR